MLLHLFWVLIFPFTICVFSIKVVFSQGWNEGSFYCLIVQGIPVETSEPLMIFDNLRSLFAKSVARFSLDQTIYEISSLGTPVSRNLSLANFDLFRKNVVSDFFSIFTVVWPLTKHAFICNYSHCKVIYCHTMVLTTHDLRSHITWSAGSILWVLGIPKPCNSQICDPEIAIFVKD